MTTPLEVYHEKLKSGDLEQDSLQEQAMGALNALYLDLLGQNNRKQRRFRLFSKNKSLHHHKGIYMYGGVGRGKSMLMDLFFEQIPDRFSKQRVHFHEFMIDLHDFMHDRRQSGEAKTGSTDAALLKFADQVSDQLDVLCFDEFHVTDVADAMLLGRLFTALFDKGLVVITTSNWPPDRLYEGGLQRELFVPFIALIKSRMHIIALDGNIDYRLQLIKDNGSYFSPLGLAAEKKMDTLFENLTGGSPAQPDEIVVKGRTLQIEQTVKGIARITFSQLCERPMGAEDYLTLAKTYHTIFLEGIPKLNYDRRNEAKRFMTLIDALYDNKVRLICSADAPADQLYLGHDHAFEFERTVSRLFEMQSSEYMEQCSTQITEF